MGGLGCNNERERERERESDGFGACCWGFNLVDSQASVTPYIVNRPGKVWRHRSERNRLPQRLLARIYAKK
jgi:hypothetical protein